MAHLKLLTQLITVASLLAIVSLCAKPSFAEDKVDKKILSKELTEQKEEEVNKTLDQLHLYAAKADGKRYFQLFTDDAIYIGTDASETWTIEQFKRFAMPYFNKRVGWTYAPVDRTTTLSKDGQYAWFVEILENEKYGTSRGTGVLINTADGWKIAQYHLTFPIPNSLAVPITKQIKSLNQQL